MLFNYLKYMIVKWIIMLYNVITGRIQGDIAEHKRQLNRYGGL